MRSLLIHLKKNWRSAKLRGSPKLLFLILFVSLLLVFFCYYPNNTTTVAHKKLTLDIQHVQGDLFISCLQSNALIVISSNKVDEAVCRCAASAYLSGVPVVVAGYQMPYHGFFSKYDFVESAIKNAKLRPHDAIIVVDSDTLFTGVDFRPFLDRFIAQSAAAPEELDVVAVRQGRAMAPVILSGEAGCWANETILGGKDGCLRRFERAKKKLSKYAAAHPEHRFSTSFNSSLMTSLNAGVTVARVWAYREMVEGIETFKKKKLPIGSTRGVSTWNCDQSVLILLYLDLLEWEVGQDLFAMQTDERQAARSSYGLHAGLLGLDYYAEVSATLIFIDKVFHLHDELWTEYLPSGGSGHPHSHSLTDIRGMGQFVRKLYRRAYATHGEKIYTRLVVPRKDNESGTSCMNHILLTPPLLAHKLVPNNTDQNGVHRVFPLIAHFAGPKGKNAYAIRIGSTYMRWYLPMMHNPDAKRCAMEYLASMPLFLSTNTSIFRTPYYESCKFIFGYGIFRRVSN